VFSPNEMFMYRKTFYDYLVLLNPEHEDSRNGRNVG